MSDAKGGNMRLSQSPVTSFFFKRFMEGMKARMGQISKPNLAMSITLLLKTIETADSRRENAVDAEDRHLWTVIVAFIAITYTISLRGPEGFFD